MLAFFRLNSNGKDPAHISLEQDILTRLAGTGKLFASQTSNWWSQVKTAGAAIYANRHYLNLYRSKKPERLVPAVNGVCKILGDVSIHPTAAVDRTAVVSFVGDFFFWIYGYSFQRKLSA